MNAITIASKARKQTSNVIALNATINHRRPFAHRISICMASDGESDKATVICKSAHLRPICPYISGETRVCVHVAFVGFSIHPAVQSLKAIQSSWGQYDGSPLQDSRFTHIRHNGFQDGLCGNLARCLGRFVRSGVIFVSFDF